LKGNSKLIAYSFLLCALSLLLLTQNALATHPVDVFGPKAFVRTTGAPNTFQESFSLPTLLGKFTLTVDCNKVSSASIKLNGADVFTPNNFNENVKHLTKEVSPKLGQNTFNIQIAGNPGSSLRLTLTFLSPVKVTVTPEKADVTVKKNLQFNANVSGTNDQRVTRSVIAEGAASAGFGSIDSTGLYTAPDYAPMPPFVTIQATSVANPFETGTATIIVRDVQNYGHSNAEGDLDAINYGYALVVGWVDLPEGTTKIVLYRSASKDAPWIEVLIDEYAIDMKTMGGVMHGETDIAPADTANDYFYKMDAFSATGQLLKSFSPVFVPKYAEESSEPQSFIPKFPILLASLSTLIPSAVSSACGSPNDPFITEAEFLNNGSMNLEKIRGFLQQKNSWLKGDGEGKILDVDGQMIDFAQVVFDTAANPTDAPQGQEKPINPQLLLTMVQKESSILLLQTSPTGKNKDKLFLIAGCGSPSTIAKQIKCAAKSLRKRCDELKSGQDTPQDPPWNLSKTTLTQDGVYVTPANAATGALFAYNPLVGNEWGGKTKHYGANYLFCKLWHKTLGFAKPCPEPPVPLTISGSETITRNSSAQYIASGCPSNVEWSVSGKGVTINSTGLLAADSTSCGSLLVTATCSACGTSATQFVRVADGGQWVLVESCGTPAIYHAEKIEGKYRYENWWCSAYIDSPIYSCTPNCGSGDLPCCGCCYLCSGCPVYVHTSQNDQGIWNDCCSVASRKWEWVCP